MNKATDRPTRMVSARTIFLGSPLPRERWNSALPRLPTMANRVMTMRILITSMGGHFILPAPMPARFSAFGREFSPSWPMTLATLVLLGFFVSLGRWQWQRGVDKQAVWAEFQRDAPAASVDGGVDDLPRFSRVE